MDGRQEWYYAHLSKIIVRAGQHVQTGQLLGYTGEANGVAHLHLAQRIGDPGIAVGRPTPGYSDRHYPG
jgi:murein DD-endopeptidase MepM/ murein hydrolase activator NlpD